MDRRTQLLSRLFRTGALQGVAAKGTNVQSVELTLDHLEQLAEDMLVVLPIPALRQLAMIVRQLVEGVLVWLQAKRLGVFLDFTAMVLDAVAEDGPQPFAERPGSLVLEIRQLPENDDQDVLSQVIRIFSQQRIALQPANDQRPVEIVELLLGFLVRARRRRSSRLMGVSTGVPL